MQPVSLGAAVGQLGAGRDQALPSWLGPPPVLPLRRLGPGATVLPQLPCPAPAGGGISGARHACRGVRRPTNRRYWSCPVAPSQQRPLHFSPGQRVAGASEVCLTRPSHIRVPNVALQTSGLAAWPRGATGLCYYNSPERSGATLPPTGNRKAGAQGDHPERYIPPPPTQQAPAAPLPPPQACVQACPPHFCLLATPHTPYQRHLHPAAGSAEGGRGAGPGCRRA